MPMTKTESKNNQYFASKISERKWGIFFRIDKGWSIFQHVTYTTKREAESVARLLNREEGLA